jgi:hypothetical protein
MKRFGVLMSTAALGAALVASAPAWARGGGHGGGFGGGHMGGFGGGHMFAGRSMAMGGFNRGFNHGFRRGGFGRFGGWGWGGWGYPYADCGYWGSDYCGYGYPGYAYGYGYPDYYGYNYGYPATGPGGYYAAAPLVTGRSVAAGQLGGYCTISVKACELHHPSYIGDACSCRVPGGRARGLLTH